VAGAQLADLRGGSGHRVLVTLEAPLRVVDGAEAIGDLIDLFERVFRRIERGLIDEPVREVVESRRCFGGRLAFDRGVRQGQHPCRGRSCQQ
jgi:hypothetical protein